MRCISQSIQKDQARAKSHSSLLYMLHDRSVLLIPSGLSYGIRREDERYEIHSLTD
jgi:hypothetical protein